MDENYGEPPCHRGPDPLVAVRAGDLLVVIDAPDLEQAVGQKDAVIAQRLREAEGAEAGIDSARAEVEVAQATVRQKEAETRQADRETDRAPA